jgi:putative SOS response-associated peptidase YedK
MCGRYAASRSPDDLVEEFEVVEDHTGEAGSGVAADFNMAPTKTAPVVLERRPRQDSDAAEEHSAEADSAPVRQLRPLVWGLVPSWAKDRSVGSRMINARAESLLDKPAYKRAATSRRCLVPADGWYEWQKSPVVKDRKGKPRKQPFFVHDADGDVVAFAGLYEFWRDAGRDPEDPDAWLTTYAIVTTEATGHLERIHDRMPLALPRDRWDSWLDPAVTDPDDVRALLAPIEVARFDVTPVSTLVNDVRNGGPELIEPVPTDELVGVVDPVTGEILGGQDSALF